MMAKRMLDLILGLALFLLSVPLQFLIALAVLIDSGRPALFRQVRAGKGGLPFTLTKFRTMKAGREDHTEEESEWNRIDRIGRFLRAHSLDELPELWHVVRGQMSLVGPRPLLMDYLPLYSPRQARRHEVKPGLTGWAQIHGRNAQSWEERFEGDVWYVENRTFGLDLKILALTVVRVLRREGITHDGRTSMTRFTGSVDRQMK
jgi:lipopolysaccharide/colanic/teichoic acid biosynthesis glycosyltransferase